MTYEAPAIVAVTELEGALKARISFLCPKDQDCGAR